LFRLFRLTSQSYKLTLADPMNETEKIQAEKRKVIIEAAVRTFVRNGYHGSRVSDIANEAGVAYGLVYHYFKNKEEILRTIFKENWSMLLRAVQEIEKSKKSLREQLEAIVHFILQAYRRNPELIEVIVLEVTRSPRFMEKESLALFTRVFTSFERMIMREKRKGGIRPGINPRIACYMILGSLETVVNGFVLQNLDARDEKAFEKARNTIVEIAMKGISKEAEPKRKTRKRS